MSQRIIRIVDLGKKYIIRHQLRERYSTLRDVMARKALNIGKKLFYPSQKSQSDQTREEIWALKDISFDVNQGEVIGIIGRNGSGKSTLLKIMSRITEPTTGCVYIKGRVASLLEVGTGFHPELTGRENVYLNGAILGMSRKEINRKFDEIVNFAEIEKFLDTPVKRYSSGMYVRLAFAVAAHLEPEILVVDEVLAVGDLKFQSKCLGKMQEIANYGRTVFLVSHNMGAISSLCTKAVLLKNGQLAEVGQTDDVIRAYLSEGNSGFSSLLDHPGRANGLKPRLMSIEIVSCDGIVHGVVTCGSSCEIVMKLSEPISASAEFSIGIYDSLGSPISHLNTYFSVMNEESGIMENEVRCHIRSLPLAAGVYSLNLAYTSGGTILDHVTGGAALEVVESDYLGSGKLPPRKYGSVILMHHWTRRAIE